MLPDVISLLVCPVCGLGLAICAADGSAVRCAAGHAFDIARQGYVNLLAGDSRRNTADTAEMVAARARLLASGCYHRLVEEVTDAAVRATATSGQLASDRPIVVLDAGAGTGEYLAATLERLPDAVGLALDLSKHAARRAARAHPRIGAVVADSWRALPVRDGVAMVILNVFAPRNAVEFARVLTPGGSLVVATPLAGHLAELIRPLGMLSVDARKDERLESTLGGRFERSEQRIVRVEMRLSRAQVRDLVVMGPSARHIPEVELQARIAELPASVDISLEALVSTWRRRG